MGGSPEVRGLLGWGLELERAGKGALHGEGGDLGSLCEGYWGVRKEP